MASTAAQPSPSVFRNANYVRAWLSRFLANVGISIESVALGWQVYNIARLTHGIEQSAFLVGMIGLVQFLPMFALALIAGETADRYDRKRIVMACVTANLVCAFAYTLLTLANTPALIGYFLVSVLFGIARAFIMPASAALGPMLVPRAQLATAIAWNSLGLQSGRVFGPLLGGLLCGVSSALAFGTAGGLYLLAAVIYLFIDADTKPQHQGGSRLLLIREGLRYIWSHKLVFGAISLDLFAVLLGGATALLPIFARDILFVSAGGFGLLRAAPFVGAALMMLGLAVRPLQHRAGATMFVAVAVFGVATIVFGLSKLLWLSVAALVVLGAADAISVYVRQSLVQIATPDAMRGRVSAVSGLFISASNELGEFESGVVARLLGPVLGAVFGGVGALAVTGLWVRLFPALRTADRLIESDKPQEQN